MTNNEIKLSADDLLGCPNAAGVKKALAFLEGCGSTTEALVAMVAALRTMELDGQTAISNMLEGICPDAADVEIAEM